MADTNWIEIFRGYGNDELLAALTKLKQGVSPFAAQSVGQKSYTKGGDLGPMLSAATRVAGERGLITITAPKTKRYFVMDHSGGAAGLDYSRP